MHRGQLHTLLEVGVIPTPATNLSSKSQAPSSREPPTTKHQSDRRHTLPYPVLELDVSLDVGAWNLELFPDLPPTPWGFGAAGPVDSGTWCNRSISPCEGDGPGATPGFLTIFDGPLVVDYRPKKKTPTADVAQQRQSARAQAWEARVRGLPSGI